VWSYSARKPVGHSVDERPPHISFTLNVLASVVSVPLIGLGTRLVSQSWSTAAFAALAWLVFVVAMGLVLRRKIRRNYVIFIGPMSDEEAKERIRSAKKEICSLQISGSEFTAHSVHVYREWLETDGNRRLRIAFADPTDTKLLESVFKLSGAAKLVENHERGLDHLRELVETGLNKYIKLREDFGDDRVDVRVYNFSPPYSVHAIDPEDEGKPGGSLFIEFYLPDVRPSERPSMLLSHDHSEYHRFLAKSRAWFRASTAAEAEPHLQGPEDGVAL
jgi:hypothetical protein